MYESDKQSPLPGARFARRLLSHSAVAFLILAMSLGFGISGYMIFEKLSLVDAFLNASMLLGGMGPVNPPQTDPGKIFAGIYALYAGLIFIVTAALLFTPVLHRLIHKFHWEQRR